MQRRASSRLACGKASSRADIEAGPARAAMVGLRRVGRRAWPTSGWRRETATSPRSRETRLVCLPCQPIPAFWASGFSIRGAVSTNTLTAAPVKARELAGEQLEPALDQVVIVAAQRIDRDVARGPVVEPGQGSSSRPVVDAEHDGGSCIRPQRPGTAAPLAVAASQSMSP